MTNVIGICSANVERSGVFEAVMNYEMQQQGLEGLTVTSAGINVEKILTNTSPLKIQVKILQAGMHYRLVRDEIRDEVEAVIAKGTDQGLLVSTLVTGKIGYHIGGLCHRSYSYLINKFKGDYEKC